MAETFEVIVVVSSNKNAWKIEKFVMLKVVWYTFDRLYCLEALEKGLQKVERCLRLRTISYREKKKKWWSLRGRGATIQSEAIWFVISTAVLSHLLTSFLFYLVSFFCFFWTSVDYFFDRWQMPWEILVMVSLTLTLICLVCHSSLVARLRACLKVNQPRLTSRRFVSFRFLFVFSHSHSLDIARSFSYFPFSFFVRKN